MAWLVPTFPVHLKNNIRISIEKPQKSENRSAANVLGLSVIHRGRSFHGSSKIGTIEISLVCLPLCLSALINIDLQYTEAES